MRRTVQRNMQTEDPHLFVGRWTAERATRVKLGADFGNRHCQREQRTSEIVYGTISILLLASPHA